jgi:hypothetical protein
MSTACSFDCSEQTEACPCLRIHCGSRPGLLAWSLVERDDLWPLPRSALAFQHDADGVVCIVRLSPREASFLSFVLRPWCLFVTVRINGTRNSEAPASLKVFPAQRVEWDGLTSTGLHRQRFHQFCLRVMTFRAGTCTVFGPVATAD